MAARFKRSRAQPSAKPPPATTAVGDEDDYLSAEFVTEQPAAPGVAGADKKTKRGKRLADPEWGKVLSKKDIAKKMEDRREEGLQQKIGEDNAGFKLLMKLGYKGGGLGKDGAGTSKPILPEMKQGRAGLGKKSETNRKKEEQKEQAKRKAARDAQHEVERREHFRSAKAAQFVDRRLQQDLNRVQRLVESLDEAEGRPRSIMWPEEAPLEEDLLKLSDANLGADQDADHVDEGGRDSSSTALAIAASVGEDGNSTMGEGALGSEGGLREEWDMMTSDEKLSACLAYLRASYFYCMYCACKYGGLQDLQTSCPGPSRDDHDEEEL